MSTILIPRKPGSYLSSEAGSIRSKASAGRLALPLAHRVNWLLAARQGAIFRGSWPNTVSNLTGGRIYHRASENCHKILIVSMVEGSLKGAGNITIAASQGAGETRSLDVTSVAAATRWGDPQWQIWLATATLDSTGIQYHKVDWDDLIVRSLSVYELPRGALDPALDTCVSLRTGAWAGLEMDRVITDGSVGSWQDIIAAVNSAQAATKRHAGGVLMPASTPWTKSSKDAWANVADPSLMTTDFGFSHKARMLRVDDASQEYDVFIRARYNGSGTGQVMVASHEAGDSVTFTALTSSLDWYQQDSGTLKVSCLDDDRLYPEIQTTDDTTNVEVASVQIVEA